MARDRYPNVTNEIRQSILRDPENARAIIAHERRIGRLGNSQATALRREFNVSGDASRRFGGKTNEIRQRVLAEPDLQKRAAMITDLHKSKEISHGAITRLRRDSGLSTGRRGRPPKKI